MDTNLYAASQKCHYFNRE